MRQHLISVVLLAALSACGGEPSSSSGSGGSSDRGEASMTLAGVEWQAERATVREKDGKLTIRASRMDIADGKASRQELHLVVSDFAGPGDYETGAGGSRFLGVGLDMKKAEGGDDAAVEAATNALKAAKHMMLAGAKVTITSADDGEVRGTFSWQPPKGVEMPAIEGGAFRAIRKE